MQALYPTVNLKKTKKWGTKPQRQRSWTLDLQVPQRLSALTHGVIHQSAATHKCLFPPDSAPNIRQLQLLIKHMGIACSISLWNMHACNAQAGSNTHVYQYVLFSVTKHNNSEVWTTCLTTALLILSTKLLKADQGFPSLNILTASLSLEEGFISQGFLMASY